MKQDLQTLVEVIQRRLHDNKWDLSDLQLTTLNVKDVFKVGSKQPPSPTSNEFTDMNRRVQDLERSLIDMNSKNLTLMAELNALNLKMLEKEEEYQRREKVSTQQWQ